MVFWKHIPLSISLWDKFQGNHEALSPWVLWTADEEWVFLPNREKVHRFIILSVPLHPKPEQTVWLDRPLAEASKKWVWLQGVEASSLSRRDCTEERIRLHRRPLSHRASSARDGAEERIRLHRPLAGTKGTKQWVGLQHIFLSSDGKKCRAVLRIGSLQGHHVLEPWDLCWTVKYQDIEIKPSTCNRLGYKLG